HSYNIFSAADGGFIIGGNFLGGPKDVEAPFLTRFTEDGALIDACQAQKFDNFPTTNTGTRLYFKDLIQLTDGRIIGLLIHDRKYEIVEFSATGERNRSNFLPDTGIPEQLERYGAEYPNGHVFERITPRMDAAGNVIGYALAGSKVLQQGDLAVGWVVLLDEDFRLIQDTYFTPKTTTFIDITQAPDGGFFVIGHKDWEGPLTVDSSRKAKLVYLRLNKQLEVLDSLQEEVLISFTRHDNYKTYTRMSVHSVSGNRILVNSPGWTPEKFQVFPQLIVLTQDGKVLSSTSLNSFPALSGGETSQFDYSAVAQQVLPLNGDVFTMVGENAIGQIKFSTPFFAKAHIRPDNGIDIFDANIFDIRDAPVLDSPAIGWNITRSLSPCGGFVMAAPYKISNNSGKLLVLKIDDEGILTYD
ncbi:MAG: hypothetical protein AAFV07_18605, partial [Bacteroidota bacterium]